jgi:hypothetical protein
MIYPFFALAAQSPTRQEAFRSTVLTHLLVLSGCAWYLLVRGSNSVNVVGHVLLIMGIIEGAILIGWRLTQMPKSLALEFLLVSQLSPPRLFVAEALVGIARLALVTLSGLPILLFLTTVNSHDAREGLTLLPPRVLMLDLVPLLVMPFTWGLVTGLGLAAWAYESRSTRRWGERLTMALIILYLVVGVLAGEKLFSWVKLLPGNMGEPILMVFRSIHTHTPFALMENWLGPFAHAFVEPVIFVEIGGLALVGVALTRASFRLKGHFHELHYRPIVDESRGPRGRPGDHPLAWWAVRRVTEYSGRINLWLAAGFGVLYAAYTVAGSAWPAWMGQGVFQIVEMAGGIPGVAVGLVVLGAVPAAFQYGLWDSNTQDRCRRLELLLLTQLDPVDYWHAAAVAAWRRGRGYAFVALLLGLAAVIAGKIGIMALAVAIASGVILWSLYFVLGFRAFTRGMQANSSGMLLTVGLPLAAFILFRFGWPAIAVLLPPAAIYAPLAGLPPLYWIPGPVIASAIALAVARRSLARCDAELRHWYEIYHGQKVID